jgi:hypothetical protein
MDPNATHHELKLAIRRGDDREAREYAFALSGWLDGGGFLPTGATREECDGDIARALDPFGDARDGAK